MNASTHTAPPPEPPRHRLPADRSGVNHHVTISSTKEVAQGITTVVRTDLYLTLSYYPSGAPAEVFARIGQAGSRVSCLVDAWCTLASIALQHGVPLDKVTEKAIGAQYEPSGLTTNPAIPRCSSPLDYIARWLLAQAEEARPPV